MTDGMPHVTWVPVPEAADAIGVSERTLWRKIRAGEVATRKRGGRTLVKIEYEPDNPATDAMTDTDTEPDTSARAGHKADKTGFDPARHVEQQVRAEEARLRLREIQGAHRELDDREQTRAAREHEQRESAEQARRDEIAVRERARLEAEDKRRREAAEAARQRRRRELVQWAKDALVSSSVGLVEIPEEVRAEARQGIERALGGMPLEELPQGEIRELAEGVWRRVTRPIVQAAEEAKRREEEQRRREREERQRAWEAEAQRARARGAAIERGKAYAEAELRGQGLGWSDEWAIMREVETALERQVAGKESQAELEKIVDGVLDARLGELEKQHRARRKGELVRHGQGYAEEVLRDVKDLDGLGRLTIRERVKRALETELKGDEDEAEVEDLVESVLDEELDESD